MPLSDTRENNVLILQQKKKAKYEKELFDMEVP